MEIQPCCLIGGVSPCTSNAFMRIGERMSHSSHSATSCRQIILHSLNCVPILQSNHNPAFSITLPEGAHRKLSIATCLGADPKSARALPSMWIQLLSGSPVTSFPKHLLIKHVEWSSLSFWSPLSCSKNLQMGLVR